MSRFEPFVAELRAVAEPSRLRLLAILARGEFAVNELTDILGQSQPRVSRHLKLLGDVGLLERFREQHWIFYRVPSDGDGRQLVDALLHHLDASDPVRLADEARVAAVLEARERAGGADDPTRAQASGSGHAELATVLNAELGEQGHGALFYYGPSPAELLGALASRARRIVGMHPSRQETQRARAALHSRGYSHCVLHQGDLLALPQPSGAFDIVVLDRSLASQARPSDALRELARLLKPGSELLLVDDYDALAQGGSVNPLTALRGWLAEAGLLCRRLRPIDLDGQHLVLAVARAPAVVTAAA